MKEIVLIRDVHYANHHFKAGTVFTASVIDKQGFALVEDSEIVGFWDNEYELYVPCLENK